MAQIYRPKWENSFQGTGRNFTFVRQIEATPAKIKHESGTTNNNGLLANY